MKGSIFSNAESLRIVYAVLAAVLIIIGINISYLYS